MPATVKVWDPNGTASEAVNAQLVEYMVIARIVKQNQAGQWILVDGWTVKSACRYIQDGDF